MKTAIIFSDHVIEVSATFQFEGSKQHSIPHEKELCVQNDINAYNYFITIQSFMTTTTTMIAQFITSLAHLYHIPTFPYKTKNRHTYHVKLFADRFSQATFHAKAVQECEKDVL